MIHRVEKGGRRVVLLAGADPVGTLYACVTFAGLLQQGAAGIVFREADVVDWPDFLAVTEDISMYHPERGNLSNAIRWGSPPSTKTLSAFVEAMKEHLDRLLAWKISCFHASEIQRWRQLSPAAMDAYRQVTDYAKARGIRSLSYAFKPFCGRISEFPDAPKRCATLHNGTRWRDCLRCWSLDDERQQNARRLAEVIRRTGITDVGFHDTDTGGFLSPAQWEERCDVCRERWGDDFAAATVHKHMIYYNAIKAVAPDCRLHFTIYPYNISVLTQAGAEGYHISRYGPSPSIPAVARNVRERFTAFWEKMTPAIPDDATFCIRENTIDNVRRFDALTGDHGVFTWYKAGREQWQTFYDETPRWLPTFYTGPRDLVFTVTLQTFLPVKSLAVREYTWNTGAPGAAMWGRQEGEAFSEHAEGGNEAYSVVLPHIVKGVFGRRVAAEITAALSANVAWNQIFDDRYRMTPVLTTYAKMGQQADAAESAVKGLDRAFALLVAPPDALGMDVLARRWFIYMREVYHCCMWMARTRSFDLLARELATAGDLPGAKKAIAAGREAVTDAQKAMERLVAERPEDPVYNADPTGNNYQRRWRRYTPTWGTDFGPRLEALAQTERELPELAAGDVDPQMVKELGRRRSVHLGRVQGKMMVDGALDETFWKGAHPTESLLVYPKQDRVARAETRIRFLASETHLYVGYTCWMPKGAPIRAQERERDANLSEDELVELFIAPPGSKGGYVHFLINAAGAISDKRVRRVKDA
ncbi:MAG: carbohydrate-binding family 9-like protein, partial [Lentisphaerae bacterium]|nr:carbohydrate-binding family 9-like protein [Lentisphaerota bacterium]